MPRANDKIGPYTLVRQLGRGAFGVVWLAERRGALATTEVAIKLTLDDEPDLKAIAQESQLWAKVGHHPNVLPIIEADIYDGQVVIVSEYAPDGSLEGWLKQHGNMAPSLEIALTMTSGILAGLEHLHAKRIIHRDIKPANILLQGEIPRLADFGLARVLKSSAHTAGSAGSPAFMSPEAFNGERSEQSDIWSVAVLLYFMLTGRVPYPQTDFIALIGAIATKDPEPLPNSVPKPLQQIIFHGLQKDLKLRYRTAAEMRKDLQVYLAKITSTDELSKVKSDNSSGNTTKKTKITDDSNLAATTIKNRSIKDDSAQDQRLKDAATVEQQKRPTTGEQRRSTNGATIDADTKSANKPVAAKPIDGENKLSKPEQTIGGFIIILIVLAWLTAMVYNYIFPKPTSVTGSKTLVTDSTKIGVGQSTGSTGSTVSTGNNGLNNNGKRLPPAPTLGPYKPSTGQPQNSPSPSPNSE